MWRRFCVLVLVLVLAGCSSGWDDIALSAAPDVSALRVTETEEVDAGGQLQLSPDGTRLLRFLDGPCVTALDGSDEQCVDEGKVSGDLTYAQWSPDGTKLVFTDDFWQRFLEPDVWVFDVTSGELRNLTDDGVDKIELDGSNEGVDIDVLPSWSADGETIRFARGTAESDTIRLMAVPVGGGEASQVREIRCATNELIGLAWSATKVAWTCGTQEADVTLADQDGGDGDVVLPREEGEDRMLLSFSPDGQWLLVDSRSAYQELGSMGGAAVAVPTDGGEPVPVADGDVGYPTWSPGGHAIAYVDLPRAGQDATLFAVPEPGGEPTKLHTAQLLGAADTLRLNWGGDKVLVHSEVPVLLTLAD